MAQLELLVEELESEQAALDADGSVGALDEPGSSEGEFAQTGADQRKRPARKPLPDHLPREALVHQPSNTERCACEGCNGALRLFGQDVAEVLEIVPARFVVIRHVRPKYTCTKCHTSVCTRTPAQRRHRRRYDASGSRMRSRRSSVAGRPMNDVGYGKRRRCRA